MSEDKPDAFDPVQRAATFERNACLCIEYTGPTGAPVNSDPKNYQPRIAVDHVKQALWTRDKFLACAHAMAARIEAPILWTQQCFEPDEGEAGLHESDFRQALQTWCFMQNRPVSVREAAIVFNVADAMVCKAVNEHAWLFLSGPDDDMSRLIIEHEGE